MMTNEAFRRIPRVHKPCRPSYTCESGFELKIDGYRQRDDLKLACRNIMMDIVSPNSQSTSVGPAASLAENRYYEAVDSLAAGDLSAAVAGFRASLAADPAYTDAAHGLMHALKDAGQFDEAILVAQGLIASDPEDVLACTSLSILYQRQGKISEAETAATRAKLMSWKKQLREEKESEHA